MALEKRVLAEPPRVPCILGLLISDQISSQGRAVFQDLGTAPS